MTKIVNKEKILLSKACKGYSLRSKACKGYSLRSKACKGYSLIEMLIAVAIFSVLGVLMAQTILLSVRTAKKSENTVQVREEIDQITNLVSGQLRNARSITTCNTTTINYTDYDGTTGTFALDPVLSPTRLIWNGNRITSQEVSLAGSGFSCENTTNPQYIILNFNATSSGVGTAEASSINIKTEINPRNYSQ